MNYDNEYQLNCVLAMDFLLNIEKAYMIRNGVEVYFEETEIAKTIANIIEYAKRYDMKVNVNYELSVCHMFFDEAIEEDVEITENEYQKLDKTTQKENTFLAVKIKIKRLIAIT